MNPDMQRRAFHGIGIALLVIGFLLPALINRQPILYPDSVGYFHSGYAAIKQAKSVVDGHRAGHAPSGPALASQQKDGITTARSVYYGLTYVASYWLAGVWALPFAQMLLALACLMLAARHAIRLDEISWFAALAAIVFLTGLNFFAVTVMPDLFAGLMLLGVAVILAYGRGLSRLEYGFWLAVIAVACLFHKAHLAILALVVVVTAAFLWRRWRDLLLLAGAGLIAFAGHFAVDLAVGEVTGKWPIQTPFALARLVGDGTAELYLERSCPTRHFATCDYLSKMPMRENDFLWSRDPEKSVMGLANRQTRAAIAAESDAIVWGTLMAYPLEELAAAAHNVLTQLGDVGVSEFALLPSDDVAPIPILRWALDHYRSTAIANGAMPLQAISAFMRAVYFSALLGIGMLIWRRRPGGGAELSFVLVLLAGMVANAVIAGAISGVFDRYQGRVAWLALFGFFVLAAQERRRGLPVKP